jgi:hypothetical protein
VNGHFKNIKRKKKQVLWIKKIKNKNKKLRVNQMRFNKMAPTMGFSSNNNNSNGNGQNNNGESLSKTYQYRKIMKPMLERKR